MNLTDKRIARLYDLANEAGSIGAKWMWRDKAVGYHWLKTAKRFRELAFDAEHQWLRFDLIDGRWVRTA